jgi:hypothetical protein
MMRMGATALALVVVGCDQIAISPPETAGLVGTYRLTESGKRYLLQEKHYTSIPDSAVEMDADQSIRITNLPDCLTNGFGDPSGRFLLGEGRWELRKGFVGYGLDVVIRSGTLPHFAYGGPWIHLRRRSPPYELEFTVGDPDSGNTLRYARAAR